MAYLSSTDSLPPAGGSTIEEEYDRAIFLQDKMNRYGLCMMNWRLMLDLMATLQEQEILTSKDTGGILLSKIDFETNLELMRMTVYREGLLGNLMAEGLLSAAQKIGRGVESQVRHIEQQVLHIKGAAPFADPRADGWSTMALSDQVYPGRPHFAPGGIGIYMPGRTLEHHIREARRIGVTEEDIERILDEEGYNVGRLLKHAYDWYSLFNCFGQCHRLYIHRFHNIEGMVEMYSAITGIETTAAELLKKGERVWNLGRIINLRCGLGREDDRLHEKCFQPIKGRDGKEHPMMDYFRTRIITREDTEKDLDDYYEESGWGKNGIPTPEKLKELGLEAYSPVPD